MSTTRGIGPPPVTLDEPAGAADRAVWTAPTMTEARDRYHRIVRDITTDGHAYLEVTFDLEGALRHAAHRHAIDREIATMTAILFGRTVTGPRRSQHTGPRPLVGIDGHDYQWRRTRSKARRRRKQRARR